MAIQLDNQVWLFSGGNKKQLSDEGLVGANPAMSPDGSRVAFVSGLQGQDLDLYLVDSDRSDLQMLYRGNLVQSSVDWAPDGSALAFDQYSDAVPLQIFVLPSDGSAAPTQLTEGEPNGKPKWGSDGRIVFLSLRDGSEQEIYRMNPDGSNQINLSHNPARDVLAELSPDASTIVFASDRSDNGDFDIWAMDDDGSNPRQLTAEVERETNPTWTSDGRHIIYRSDRNPAGLWYMNPDGSDQRPLLADAWIASCP